MAVQFEGGVVIGADTRTTTGAYIVSLNFDTQSAEGDRRTLHVLPKWKLGDEKTNPILHPPNLLYSPPL